MTPPRAPPPRGGCCYSQPESLGEGEEAEAAASAICRGEVGARRRPGRGSGTVPPPRPPPPQDERRGLRVMVAFFR